MNIGISRFPRSRWFALTVFSLSLTVAACGGSSVAPWIGTQQLGAAGADSKAEAVISDKLGNVYVTGFTRGDLDGNTLSSAGSYDLFVTKYDSTGAKQWTEQMGATGSVTDTEAFGVAADSKGNVYVTGYTSGDLDGNTLTGTYDLFVTKYDGTGAKQWTRQTGEVGTRFHDTEGYAITVDSSDNIFVVGYTDGDLDGVKLTGLDDFFLIKYNTSGTKQWTRLLGAASASTEAMGVTSDTSGNIYVAGYTNGDLDGNVLNGGSDLFVTQYDHTGVKKWTRQLGVTGASTVTRGIASDSGGNVYIAGWTEGGLDGNTLTGIRDLFLMKFDNTGTKKWSRQMGVASTDTEAHGVAVDANDYVYIAGGTYGGLDGNSSSGAGDGDLFVTRYDSSGTKKWTRQLGAPGPVPTATVAYGVATHGTDSVFVVGYTSGGLDGNILTGTNDIFLVQYNSGGSKQ